MRSAVLTAGSLFLTAAVIGNAYYQKTQFYPSVVYITKSNPSMAVMYIQALVIVLLTGELMRKVFFGQLRAAELEHLIDRSWYVVTETCLAFTIFRDDFSPKFVALFTLLLFLKCFHWLGDDRVDYMERSPVITLVFHVRAIALLLVLGTLDAYFVQLAYHSMVTKGASVQLVFGFEYAILLTVVINIFIKYILHTVDLQSENPWENKAVFLLYTELAVGLVKMLLYILFVIIMIKTHTFPLFAIRPMYLTMKTFKKALNDVIMSRRAIRNMNTLYPDATVEELATMDNVCIICREEMATASKKLPCNHIFHTSCLRSWFQRQQTCPTCRMDVLRLPATAARLARQAAPQQPAPAAAAHQGLAGAAGAANDANRGGLQQPQMLPGQPPFNIPGFFPNGFMAPFPMWMPPAPPQAYQPGPAQPQQTPTTTGQGHQIPTPAAGAAASSSGSGAANGVAPGSSLGGGSPDMRPPMFAPNVMPPMFPPFFMPPFIPPPMPPPDFAGLTEEELRRMEGDERGHVESRVQCLRNIQTLLDAAVLQMQQYTLLTVNRSRSGQQSAPSSSSPSQSGAAEKRPQPSTSRDGQAAASSSHSDSLSRDGSSISGAAIGVSPPVADDSTEDVAAAFSSNDDDSSLDEREALRRRRLHKFSEKTTGGEEHDETKEAAAGAATSK